jgi:pyridoxine kinase
MREQTPKKLLIVNDMTGFGRCSIAVALPIISTCKVQAIPVPTSVFSNHTGFPTYYKKDMTVYMQDYLKQLDTVADEFDGIYCGYFGSLMQMHIMEEYIKKHIQSSKKKPVIIIDPVMGDHGNPYHSITADFCQQMQKFIQNSDLLTPNITEACLLTNTPYHDGSWTETELTAIADLLASMGPSQIVITGICDHQYFHNYIRQSDGSHTTIKTPVSGSSRPGTGDIFASIVAALIMRCYDLPAAVETASSFIAKCTRASDEAGVPTQEGVLFELFLNELTVL